MQAPIEPDMAARERRPRESGRGERRGIWLKVLLPVTIALGFVIALAGVFLSLRSPVQVSLLADSMLTALVLCPLVVCMFPLVMLSVGLVALLNRWHSKSRSPLRRLEAWTALMERNIEGWLGNVDERVLDWAVRIAPLRQLLTAFDPPATEAEDEGGDAK